MKHLQTYSFSSFQSCILALLTLISWINSLEIIVDVDSDVEGALHSYCENGYKPYQNFTCDGALESAIPPEEQTNSVGIWTTCGDPLCYIMYSKPLAEIVTTSLEITGYYKGENASILVEIFVDHNITEVSLVGNGWKSETIDLTTFEDFMHIDRIRMTPMYESIDEFAVIDKFILVTTETTVVPSSTTPVSSTTTTEPSTTTTEPFTTTTEPSTTTTEPSTTTTEPSTTTKSPPPTTTLTSTTDQPSNVMIDKLIDIRDGWGSECQGYFELQEFTCHSSSFMIPVEDHNDHVGYWTSCNEHKDAFSCVITYTPRIADEYRWNQLTILAYFYGDAVVEVSVRDSTSSHTSLLGGSGWQRLSIDLSQYSGIELIQISPEFHPNSYAIVDQITLSEEVLFLRPMEAAYNVTN